ncbi:serpin family protein [Thermococcus sp. 21S7]|uniref:serpin family protein n=1 Tax=Thermococcus sp. 21S7 TaxID=1638221 RepID=UPI00143CB28C|nr:serpin family protein [Thermococcus sp. 21S7]NJE62178.1 serpin family protein [Thermococcus sp. 21S7]
MRRLLALALVFVVIASGCIANNEGTPTAPQNPSSETPIPPMTGNDVLDPTQTEEAMDVVGASNLFGIELYRELSRENGNLFISPFSVFTAMTMAYEGARGETAGEMAKVLHIPENETLRREAFRTLLLDAGRPSGIELRIANALWVQKDYPVREEYLDTIRRYYLGDVEELDFRGDPEGAERTINEWAEEKTNGRIKNLVSGLTPDTRLIITNAVYFKANWTLRFSPDATKNDTFTLPTGERVTVPMMNRVGKFNYAETDEIQALEMPYEGSRFSNFSMVIILPKKRDGLNEIEEKLSPRFLQGLLSSLKPEEVDVTVPKFRFEGEYQLGETLRGMGMRKAFTDRADFSGISEEPIAISEVVHKTFISVAENGTEAAAATAVIFTAVSAPGETPEYKVFRADHPFLFLIVDRDSGLVLFIGRLVDPRG